MKLCEKCGKEFETEGLRCPACRKEEKKDQNKAEEKALAAAEKTFPIFIVIGAVLTAGGVAAALFTNFLVGIALLILAEAFCLVPTVMIKKAVRRSNTDLLRLELDERTKAVTKEMKAASVPYKICRALSLIALVAIFAVLFMNV